MARASREGIDLLKLCFGLVLESIDFVLRFQGRPEGCWFPYIDKKTLCGTCPQYQGKALRVSVA